MKDFDFHTDYSYRLDIQLTRNPKSKGLRCNIVIRENAEVLHLLNLSSVI